MSLVMAGLILVMGTLLVVLNASAIIVILCSIFIILFGAVFYMYLKKQLLPIELIWNGLEILRSGNLNYRTRLSRLDVYGKISEAIDELADRLENSSRLMQNIELDSEVLVDRMREAQTIEERFQLLFDNPNYGIFLCEFDGRIRDVNHTGCRMLDYTRNEMIQLSFYDLYVQDELNRSVDATKIGDQKQAIRFESKFLTKSGRVMDVEISSNIYDFKNEIIQNIVSDISHRKRIESELKESEEKFRSFMESATELMFITDTSEKIIYANQAMINVLGMPIEMLRTKKLSDLSYTETTETGGGGVQEYEADPVEEIVWISESGRKIYGELVTSVIINDNNQFSGLRGVFRDITERKKISENRRLAQLGKLMADVAHEVKNRLMAIMSISEFILMDSDKDSEIGQDMQMIHEECRTMDDFVRQMLNFSRPSDGIYQPADIHHILDSVLKLISKSLKRDHIQVQKNYAKKIPVVYVDEKQMSEVFMNIIQNAHEAMEKGEMIEIRTFSDSSKVQIDIRDHGSGIPEDILQKIFDPFFTTKETGTGLGISACYGILKAHGGELHYTSEIGVGTTAHIILPVKSGPGKTANQKPQ